MPKITGSTIVKLLILSLLVGFALAATGTNPQDLLVDTWTLAKDIFEWGISQFGSVITYVMLGATIVIPIWLILYLIRAARGKS